MSSENKVYVGDEGTVIELDCGEDISTATVTDIKVRKPDGTLVTWTGSKNGGVNSQIDYTVVTDDFDQPGAYRLQAYVEMPSGKWRGESVSLLVYKSFD